MGAVIYQEEMAISEITLALLEDTGWYKINYYTGGLMRFGKNKGCDFVRGQCVDKTTHKINPLFYNEFFDTISIGKTMEPSCSPGRQSRTYNAFWVYDDIPVEPKGKNKYMIPKEEVPDMILVCNNMPEFKNGIE